MRTLSIDPGEKRVGLAISDAGGQIATPLDVLEVPTLQRALPHILRLIEQEGVQRLVVGLPLNMDGSAGPEAQKVRTWAGELQRQSGQPLCLVDERLSSFAAEQHLSQRRRHGEKLTHKRKKQQRDSVAAAILLQEFLDGSLPPLE
jgi:putative holliday junction resolvase